MGGKLTKGGTGLYLNFRIAMFTTNLELKRVIFE